MLKKVFTQTPERELGFGKSVATKKGERMMNPDGFINVARHSTSVWDNVYFHLITMSHGRFFLLIGVFFACLNAIFALLYCMIGIEHLSGLVSGDYLHNFMEASFFSTQTLTTVGYGRVAPVGFWTNIVASTESLTGLLSFALISGLLYGRFSRPIARIVFSDNMLVSPYKNGRGLMFRIVNSSRSEMIETEVQIILAINQTDENGIVYRRFLPLDLEISKISFFAFSWTIVHHINEKSPLWGLNAQDLEDLNTELMLLIKGVDESNEQVVHARKSYIYSEIVWNAKFKPVLDRDTNGLPTVVTSKLSEYQHTTGHF